MPSLGRLLERSVCSSTVGRRMPGSPPALTPSYDVVIVAVPTRRPAEACSPRLSSSTAPHHQPAPSRTQSDARGLSARASTVRLLRRSVPRRSPLRWVPMLPKRLVELDSRQRRPPVDRQTMPPRRVRPGAARSDPAGSARLRAVPAGIERALAG